MPRGVNQGVILSEAKDHLERDERRKIILRFAQDDSPGFIELPRNPTSVCRFTGNVGP